MKKQKTINPELQKLVDRLQEAKIDTKRFLKVLPNKEPLEVEWQKHPYDVESLPTYESWGIIGNHPLALVDCDKEEIANIIREKLPATLEVLSPNRKLPHFYFKIEGDPLPNKDLFLPKSKVRAGEVRTQNKFLVCAGTKTPKGIYKILADRPIATVKSEDFKKVIAAYLNNGNLTIDEIRHGAPKGSREDRSFKYGLLLLGTQGLTEEDAWYELKRWNQKNIPPLDETELRHAFDCAVEDLKPKDKFIPYRCALELAKSYPFKTDRNTEILYRYNAEKGKWISDGEIFLKVLLGDILKDQNKTNCFYEVLYNLKSMTYEEMQFSEKISCKNGLLDAKKNELTPFDPKEMCRYSIPVEYDPKAKCPNFEKFLKEVLPPEDILLLQEISGYLLNPNYSFHYMFWFWGDGRNGKGTWSRTMEAMLGDHVSHVGIEEFDGEHRFSLYTLVNSLLNISSEPPTKKVFQTQIIKSLTGQDTIDAEIKNKQARLKYRNTAKMVIIGNLFPIIKDFSLAFRDRTVFIKWEKEFVGKDRIPDIENQWLKNPKEKSGILNWMLEGLARLLKNGDFTKTKTESETMMEFQRVSDTIGAFLTEMVTYALKSRVNRTDLYEAYQEYCESIGKKPESTQNFTQYLRKTPKIYPLETVVENKRVRMWSGIALKNSPLPKELVETKVIENDNENKPLESWM